MTKKTEPNVLFRLFNIVVSDKEVKAMLDKQVATMPAACRSLGLSKRAARLQIADDLTAWMHESGLTGRGTKRMVDKVTSKALKGYDTRLRLKLMAEAAEAKKDNNEHTARAINARLKAGQIGKERYQEWPTRW